MRSKSTEPPDFEERQAHRLCHSPNALPRPRFFTPGRMRRATGVLREVLPALRSLICLPEVPQIRRGLVPPGRHQRPVRAEEIVFLAEDHLVVAFGAVIFTPIRMWIRVASIGLVDRPWPRQSMVDCRYLVMENERIGLVEIEALREYRLIVEVQRQPCPSYARGPLKPRVSTSSTS